MSAAEDHDQQTIERTRPHGWICLNRFRRLHRYLVQKDAINDETQLTDLLALLDRCDERSVIGELHFDDGLFCRCEGY